MNTVIAHPSEFIGGALRELSLTGARAQHLIEVLKVTVDKELRVGVIGLGVGVGRVVRVESDRVFLSLGDLLPGPTGVGLTLYLALPRPQMLKRIFQFAATVGIETIHLFSSARVEKSYFSSPILSEAERYFIEGLEQGGRTELPELFLHRNFRTFVGEVLPGLSDVSSRRLLLTPNGKQLSTELFAGAEKGEVVIGPEGGLLPEEEERFMALGFLPAKISSSILRVEQAVYYATAQFEGRLQKL